MNRSTKIWLIAATALILAGVILFGVTMSLCGWDFLKLSTTEFTTTTHEISESFKGVTITASTADITVLPSEDGTARVICREDVKQQHRVEVADGTLKITATDSRAWHEMIGISFENTAITLYLPGDVISSLDISVSTGDVKISDLICQGLKFHSTTGDLWLKDLTVSASLSIDGDTGDCKLENTTISDNLDIEVGTGDVDLKNTVAKGDLTISSTTGSVTLDRCDAANIYVTVSTGDVNGILLSDKDFSVSSSTGDAKYPDTHTGGKCEITTATGDVNITVQK